MKNQQKKFSRRLVAVFWFGLVGIVIGTLIYLEQIAVLYVLATVSLVALLLVVAYADLEKVGADSLGGFSRDSE
ncbi:MAG: hypothetical protein ABIU09_11935 [Pyrinomonadaceae bacterium]